MQVRWNLVPDDYWRIDEVMETDTVRGPVWQFTTE